MENLCQNVQSNWTLTFEVRLNGAGHRLQSRFPSLQSTKHAFFASRLFPDR